MTFDLGKPNKPLQVSEKFLLLFPFGLTNKNEPSMNEAMHIMAIIDKTESPSAAKINWAQFY